MAKLTLEGFLLTPVQRICRYPLQLFELLKATPPRHRDRIALEQAHCTMRAVAAHINDAKRRVDAIQKIVLWQRNVHGFRVKLLFIYFTINISFLTLLSLINIC